MVEPLASYFPQPILNLLVESVARREIKLEFPVLTVVFVNLIGLSQAVDRAQPGEEHGDLCDDLARLRADQRRCRGAQRRAKECHLRS